jgi:hypothetical protein
MSVGDPDLRGLWEQIQEKEEAIRERDRTIRFLEGQLARLKQITTASTDESAMSAIEVRE